MTKFEINKTYEMNSVCNNDCKWIYTVLNRTNKTILIQGHGEIMTKRIHVYDDIERVRPLGKYSMSPVLSADKEINK